MTIKIDKTEREYFEKAAAELDLKCEFYTMENNGEMMICQITELDGDKLTELCTYAVGRVVGYAKAMNAALSVMGSKD